MRGVLWLAAAAAQRWGACWSFWARVACQPGRPPMGTRSSVEHATPPPLAQNGLDAVD